jgi:hypothetical protein
MYKTMRTVALAVGLLAVPSLFAQVELKVADRAIQIHSFASQGFAYSDENNFLSMDTSHGSFAFTDAGANASSQLTDKLRVGAQFYIRNVGHLGNWHPDLDWAMADYRFKDWFGVRGGKVKTVLGLYNDTQDMEFLHTWALMPLSVYPVDSRGDVIAHLGGDVYGNISLKRLGGLAYTVYGGERPSDPESGLVYGLETSSLLNGKYIIAIGKKIDSYGGPVYGADLRWTTPVKGLLVGASYMDLDVTVHGSYVSNGLPYTQYTNLDKTIATYVQYSLGNFTFAGEYRREPRSTKYNTSTNAPAQSNKNSRQGYVSAAYRISKRLEVGAYHARHVRNWEANHGDPSNHIFDQVVTARVDLTHYLDFKAEGHFIDGALIDSVMSRGFFATSNPNGITPQTKMVVLRLGFHI